MNKTTPNDETFTRQTIQAQRDSLILSREKIRLDLAYYEGAIKSLDLLLNPEPEPQPESSKQED